MSQKKTTLAEALPSQFADAIKKLRAAGLNPLAILALILEYGPALLSMIQEIIDAFRAVESKAAAVKAAQGAAAQPKGCDEALAEAMCVTQCHLIEALYAHHLAMHEAGCCIDAG